MTETPGNYPGSNNSFDRKLDRIAETLDSAATTINNMAAKLDGVTERLDSVAEKLDGVTEKLDVLTDQVGRLTEGMTAIHLTTEQQAETARLQAQSIDRLINLVQERN